MREDLAKSGLTPSDIDARPLDAVERAATGTPNSAQGYVIPYFDIFGRPIPFYRVRLFGNDDVKYRQPRESATHIYFPKQFIKLVNEQTNARPEKKVIFITEGEKKAAIACKLGFATVGLGGVDAWRSRIIQMPGEPVLSVKTHKDTKVTKAKLDSGTEATEDYTSSLAIGFQDLLDLLLQTESTVIIVFDSDRTTGVQPQVQRAAAVLGFELRNKGVPFSKVRQIILPFDQAHDGAAKLDKMGLDDYLVDVDAGYELFQGLVTRTLQRRSAFPRHPSIMDYIGKRLQKARLSRKEGKEVSLAMLSELDATGIRLRSHDEKQTYYFDLKTRTLMKAGFLYGQSDEGHESPFGGLLYRRFGIGSADQKTLQWLSAQFNSELPIGDVSPERIIARPKRDDGKPDCVRYAINDGQYVTISAGTLEVDNNGANQVLFEGGHVAPLDARAVAREYTKRSKEPLNPWWNEVLSDVRLKDHDKAQKLHTLLYYISPWLYRWQGTQLPIELLLGESGSGKSTLSELRLSIITGDPKLRNAPLDIKDWHASIINSGGLHVTDNVQLTDHSMRQRLSDELCRIVTEPTPFVEMRRYYTNAELVRYPVRSVFCITAINQPFQNADVLQRSVILELEKPAYGNIEYNMNWVTHQLNKHGGREAWVAHHLYVLSCFFKLVKEEWDPRYRAKHRLINLEQALITMAKVFNWKYDWIPEYLLGITHNNLTSSDWAFEGIADYCTDFKNNQYPDDAWLKHPILATSIASWCQTHEEHGKCEVLINPRKLGRYMKAHRHLLATVIGLVEAGMYNNRLRYRLQPEERINKDVSRDLQNLVQGPP